MHPVPSEAPAVQRHVHTILVAASSDEDAQIGYSLAMVTVQGPRDDALHVAFRFFFVLLLWPGCGARSGLLEPVDGGHPDAAHESA